MEKVEHSETRSEVYEEARVTEECTKQCKCKALIDLADQLCPRIAECIMKCVPEVECPVECCTEKDDCIVEPDDKCEEREEFIDNNYAAESEEEEEEEVEEEESEPSEPVDDEASHSPIDNRQCDKQQVRCVLLEFALKFYPELAECISKCVSNEECAVVEPEEQNYSPPIDDKPMEPEEFIDNNYAAESEEEEEEEEEEVRCTCDKTQLLQFLENFVRNTYPQLGDCILKCMPDDKSP
uniref:Trypsin Inhibitor like cysteine rich domain protein n=1 Tax=Mesocestoides corti TaxID=53468 RepID=A0A5K3FX78_MESCO